VLITPFAAPARAKWHEVCYIAAGTFQLAERIRIGRHAADIKLSKEDDPANPANVLPKRRSSPAAHFHLLRLGRQSSYAIEHLAQFSTFRRQHQ
jgi:hypothetical protein